MVISYIWHNYFIVFLSPKKSANGKRKYTSDDIIIIKQIFFLLKEKGFTIEGAKTYIKEAKKKPMNSFEIIEKLNEIKSRLLKIKNEL